VDDKTVRPAAVEVSIDSPSNHEEVSADAFCATGGYSTSYGAVTIKCKIQGKEFAADVLSATEWQCTCSGLEDTGGREVPLKAEIYVGSTQGTPDTHSVKINSNIAGAPCGA